MSDLKKGTRVIPGLPKGKQLVSRLSLGSDFIRDETQRYFPYLAADVSSKKKT